MQYNIKLNNFETPNIYEINKLSPRAYLIPFCNEAKRDEASFIDERYLSDKIIILSGEWKFKYYKDCTTLPAVFDTAVESFDNIKVPSTWQRVGVENPNYLNTRYQFKLNPPHIPKKVPVGVYKKDFKIAQTNKTFLINFLGVCSCFDLFVNGKFVGYSEGSHNTAEFDITENIIKGDNELVAVVYKWCNGSYLECQDMFRENGIFRDVYIIVENKSYLSDFNYTTQVKGDKLYDLAINFNIANPTKDGKLILEFLDKNGKVIFTDSIKESKTYKDLKVEEWSAETPTLYQLKMTYDNGTDLSYFKEIVGFKNIAIKEDLFLFNKQKIKIKGVNHHESHPISGWTMTNYELEKDIKIIKSFNCNAVRLSHYPHDPLFLKLCDIYGLYSIDEMDIECHGIYSNVLRQKFGWISDNLDWKEHFLDRAKRMYYRDRNRVSVIMWSLGNEAGGEKCHTLCYQFFKSVSDIPVHYEGVVHTKQYSYDVISHMYTHTKVLENIADKTVKDKRMLGKPFFLCEYAHAMGVGPGGLSQYFDLFLANDNFMGGCIWEFCDHTVHNPNAKYKNTYGGDHFDKKHDGNFCVDGLFFPDRNPSTGALNMREVYRPIRVAKVNDNEFKLTNTNFFKDSADIAISYNLLKNGLVIAQGKVKDVISANSSSTISIKYPEVDEDNDYIVEFCFNGIDGAYIAKEQIEIVKAKAKTIVYAPPTYDIATRFITVNFDKGSLIINKDNGALTSYCLNGIELINQKPIGGKVGLKPNMFRSLIDNDRFIKILWLPLGLLKAKPRLISSEITNDGIFKVVTKYRIKGFGNLANCTITMEVATDGVIVVKAKLSRGYKLMFYSQVTRFGLTLELNKQFENVNYYGLGDRETLSDFDDHGFVGNYNLKVHDMHENYIKPQESGNRSKVRWFSITNDNGVGLKVSHIDNYLNFNANHFTRYQLSKAKHQEDLQECDTTNVQIDGFVRGTGSQSCGQGPTASHLVSLKKPLEFSFVISPITCDSAEIKE